MSERPARHEGEVSGPSGAPSVVVRSPRRTELDAVRALMIEVIARDYGYDYRAGRHDDVDDPGRFYLDHPRHALFVAVDEPTGRVLGTAGVRVLAITSPPHPAELVGRYEPGRTAELTRVFVRSDARRRGVGRALVDAAARRVAEIGGFDMIALHSRTAVEFWRALPTTEILDNRQPGVPGPAGGQVYFELAMPGGIGGPSGRRRG